jgi:hypothetical protein
MIRPLEKTALVASSSARTSIGLRHAQALPGGAAVTKAFLVCPVA